MIWCVLFVTLGVGVGVSGYICPDDPPPNCPCDPCSPCPENLMETQLCYIMDTPGCGMREALIKLAAYFNCTVDNSYKTQIVTPSQHRYNKQWCSAHTNVLFGPHPVLCYNASDDATSNDAQDSLAAPRRHPPTVSIGACPKDKSTNDNRINIITNFYKNTKKMSKEDLKQRRKSQRKANKKEKKGYSKENDGKSNENGDKSKAEKGGKSKEETKSKGKG
ncbi:unnamed protein product [Owenia fusiformis]|uniref:Secreted protein n=1 Tax=Owenia fusiformis TaxID=6347 RepID=A0A8S4PDT3_OWEFU|nr:unnamed protein product [Owenia fusiformis]